MRTEQPTFIAHDIGDVFAAVPTFFGFVPQESVIAVSTHGPRARFGFRLRLDLPRVDMIDVAAQEIERHVRNQRPDGVVLLVLSADHERAEHMLVALRDRFADIDIVVCARADGTHYWVVGDPEPVPYDARLSHPAVVTAVANGQEILTSREQLVERFAAVDDPEVAAAAESALDRALAAEGAIAATDIALLGVGSSAVAVRDGFWLRITRDNAIEMLRVWADVARRIPDGLAPASLSLAAFAAWLAGDGVQANIAVDRALHIDGRCRLAAMMRELLDSGADPRL